MNNKALFLFALDGSFAFPIFIHPGSLQQFWSNITNESSVYQTVNFVYSDAEPQTWKQAVYNDWEDGVSEVLSSL